jgi:hypothetical protein
LFRPEGSPLKFCDNYLHSPYSASFAFHPASRDAPSSTGDLTMLVRIDLSDQTSVEKTIEFDHTPLLCSSFKINLQYDFKQK